MIFAKKLIRPKKIIMKLLIPFQMCTREYIKTSSSMVLRLLLVIFSNTGLVLVLLLVICLYNCAVKVFRLSYCVSYSLFVLFTLQCHK